MLCTRQGSNAQKLVLLGVFQILAYSRYYIYIQYTMYTLYNNPPAALIVAPGTVKPVQRLVHDGHLLGSDPVAAESPLQVLVGGGSTPSRGFSSCPQVASGLLSGVRAYGNPSGAGCNAHGSVCSRGESAMAAVHGAGEQAARHGGARRSLAGRGSMRGDVGGCCRRGTCYQCRHSIFSDV